jgi:chemotaxis protein CheD
MTHRRRIYLGPAEWHLDERPARVITVVGSCVAVTVYHPRRRIGVLCHCMLPVGKTAARNAAQPAMYVDETIPAMLAWFERRGIDAGELEVKLFGGADMATLGGPRSAPGVGWRNVEISRKIIGERGLRVAASDVGGSRGRKIVFLSDTGEVYLKRLQKTWRKDSRRVSKR